MHEKIVTICTGQRETIRVGLKRLFATCLVTLFLWMSWRTIFSTSAQTRHTSQQEVRCWPQSTDTKEEGVVVIASTACLKCNQKTLIGPANAVVHMYTKQPWFSWLELICMQCEQKNHMFFGPDNWRTEVPDMKKLMIGFLIDEFAPDEIVASYEDVYDIIPIKGHELTPRAEAYVSFFAYLLERGETIE